MTAVSQRIPNLLGGVSQQPDSLKLPGQVREALNCSPDPTFGMRKRPGMRLVSSLTGATDEGRWFAIFRDNNEQYIGQFEADGDLKIWDAFTGAAKTVNTVSAAAKAYIANCSKEDFEMLQINDYNFILNRSKVVGKLATLSPTQVPTAIVSVNLIGYDVQYKVKVNSTTVNYKTPATGTLDLKDLVEQIRSKIDAVSNFDATAAGNTIVVKCTDGSDFTIDGDGGLSSQALLVYKDSVPNVSRLPSACINGTVLKVSNLDEAAEDDYYVKFKVTQGGTTAGTGEWEEDIKPGIETHVDPDTMPHVIIRQSNGTFTFRSLNEAAKAGEDLYWVERRVGDNDTNPFPSMVGKKITGISFFRNRLILLSESNVLCSQPGSYFNFFRLSALTQTDADAVDLATGSLSPVALRHALGDQQGLLIFSEKNQFILTSDTDQFGPVSARVVQFSTYNMNTRVRPVETGVSYVFVDANRGYSKVSEMVAASAENRPSMADLSRTAPNYVPADLESMVVSSSAEVLSFLGTQDRTKLQIFKFFNNNGERVMASWLTWTLPGECLFQASDQDLLWVVTEQENGICLSYISLITDVDGTAINSSGISYEYRLDLFDNSPILTYDSGTDQTKVFFKTNAYDSTLTPMVVVNDSAVERGSIYVDPTASSTGGWHVLIPGDRTGADGVTLGYQYEYKLALPVFYMKRELGEGRSQSDVVNIPRVTKLVIQSNDSGPYEATVDVLGRTTKNYPFSHKIANQYLANSAPTPDIIDNTIPIYGKGTDSSVVLKSTSPFPVSLVAATWYGIFSTRGIRAV